MINLLKKESIRAIEAEEQLEYTTQLDESRDEDDTKVQNEV